MKVKFLQCILFLGFILLARHSNAGHIAGANISYKAIDSVNYEVTLKAYTDCSVSPTPINDSLDISWNGGGFRSKLTYVSSKDVTGSFNGCSVTSKCASGTFPYGYTEVIYTTTVNVAGAHCKVTFSWSGVERTSSISTGPANTNLYIFAEVNKCFGLNNSAQNLHTPKFLATVGQDYLSNLGLIDTADGDSLRFSVVPSQSAANKDITYVGGYSVGPPITYLGHPQSGQNLPAGFHYNGLTGELAFRANKQNEVATLAFEAIEYRKINGQMEEVGRTRFEHIVRSISGQNKEPRIISATAFQTCAGYPFNLFIEGFDLNTQDSTFLNISNLMSGASLTVGKVKKTDSLHISWTPTNADVSNQPHIFTVEVRDNACDLNGKSIYTFSIYVSPRLDADYFVFNTKTVSCNRLNLGMKLPAPTGLQRTFTAPKGIINYMTPDSAEIWFPDSGWNKIGVFVKYSFSCADTLWDSVFVQPSYKLQMQLTPDTLVCPGTPYTLSAMPINGSSPYSGIWFINGNKIPGSMSITRSQTFDSFTYVAYVTDSVGCFAKDSTMVSLHKLQQVLFGTSGNLCKTGADVVLSATPPNGKWGPVSGPNPMGFYPPDTIKPSTVTTTNTYMLKYTASDSNNCQVTRTYSYKVDEIIPSVSFIANPDTGFAPLNSRLSVTDSSVSSVTWIITPVGAGSSDTVKRNGAALTYIFKDTGWYDITAVCVKGGCTTTITQLNKVYVLQGPVGMAEFAIQGFKIYPNPAKDFITVEFSEPQTMLSASITDITGKEVNGFKIEGNQIMLNGVESGVYFIKIFTESNRVYYAKIMVE